MQFKISVRHSYYTQIWQKSVSVVQLCWYFAHSTAVTNWNRNETDIDCQRKLNSPFDSPIFTYRTYPRRNIIHQRLNHIDYRRLIENTLEPTWSCYWFVERVNVSINSPCLINLHIHAAILLLSTGLFKQILRVPSNSSGSHTKSKKLKCVTSRLWAIHWNQVLCRELRCSRDSADRWCSHHIWVWSTGLLQTKVRIILDVP